MEYKDLLIQTAYNAGEAIMKIYNSNDFDIELKGDNSPLTKADKNAHEVIMKALSQTKLPILSEEGVSVSYERRKNWRRFWMVDPLDGTKEFIKRNGEFTVNIALIEDGKPIFGVVYAPVLDKMYYGGKGVGVYLISDHKEVKLKKKINSLDIVRVVASRSHLNQDTQKFIDKFKKVEKVLMGSSLKFMLLAEGKADYYPRFAPTMEWDTAAAHAIVNAIGYEVLNSSTRQALVYNKEDLLNPHFLVSQK